MASSRSKNSPRGPQKKDAKVLSELLSIRVTTEQRAKIDALRGADVPLTTFIQGILDDYLTSPRERAIRDCQEHNALRGVTPDMLLKATKG